MAPGSYEHMAKQVGTALVATQTTTPARFHPEGLELVSPKGEARGYVEPKQVNGRFVLEDLLMMRSGLACVKVKAFA